MLERSFVLGCIYDGSYIHPSAIGGDYAEKVLSQEGNMSYRVEFHVTEILASDILLNMMAFPHVLTLNADVDVNFTSEALNEEVERTLDAALKELKHEGMAVHIRITVSPEGGKKISFSRMFAR